jgi:hypothetical protein
MALLKLCKDCPTDITDTHRQTKFCKPCVENRKRARSRAQSKERRCFMCKDKLVNPGRGTKYCSPCKVVVVAMDKQQQRRNAASNKYTKRTGGESVAAKIARIVAADSSYCTDYGSPEI